MRIGFLGLGQMGAGMAANLLRAGHQVTVWNRSPGRDADLLAAGATRAATPADAAQGDLVCSMLADDAAVEAVVWGPDGIAGAPALHVSHSTIGPALVERLAALPDGLVSAPVFGRPPAAAAAQLVVVAAGTDALVERAAPVFDAIGRRTFRVGERPAQANLVKLGGNFMIMAAIEAMAEAATLAEAGGVGRGDFLEVMTATLFDAPAYRNYAPAVRDGVYTPVGFAAPLGLKDMGLVDAAATAARVPMPVLAVVRQQLLAAIANEGEAVDWSAVASTVRRNAGRG